MSQIDPLLVDLEATKRIVGQSRSAIYEGIKQGAFPKPIKIGAASRWVFAELQAWVAQKIAERDGVDQCEARDRAMTDELVTRAAATSESLDDLVVQRRAG